MANQYQIVGHRGFPQRFPENSLPGLIAAAKTGAHCIEVDVQISQDGIPMVFHDETLDRVTESKGEIWNYAFDELNNISCHDAERLGDAFNPTYIVSLEQACEALASYDVHLFVEVKELSLEHISRQDMISAIRKATQVMTGNVTIISFDYDVLTLAQAYFPIGWALREMDADRETLAAELKPQVLIFDVKKLSEDSPLWLGPWQWFLYDIVDKEKAEFWAGRGVYFIETWDVEALL